MADVNGDGQPDFFVGHSNRFFLSTGDGKYREPPELRKALAWEPLRARLAVGDARGFSLGARSARQTKAVSSAVREGAAAETSGFAWRRWPLSGAVHDLHFGRDRAPRIAT